jgi:hypothetical protein
MTDGIKLALAVGAIVAIWVAVLWHFQFLLSV